MERTLLVNIKIKTEKDNTRLEEMDEELQELALSSRAEVIESLSCTIEKPTPNFFIGRGKAQEIALMCNSLFIDTVIFGRELSGTQQRNLEEVIGKKTIDRTQLILDIFARHAKSPEGKMQVELAQLQYLMPRLIGKGIILSRLGGGIGTRGPGEQKLEIDRRRIRQRIDKLQADLKHVALHRMTIRKKRKDNAVPTIALVGYTNAGKSTLLNSLTRAGQVVADSLFTTLDPLSKNLTLPNGEHVVISDTVGFLRGLPHNLIEAFKATLEEVTEADLLIHVLDVSHPSVHEKSRAVYDVLKQLNAQSRPLITALNKIDLLEDKTWLATLMAEFPRPVAISAVLGQNLELLCASIQESFKSTMVEAQLRIPHTRMDLVNLFYREGSVKEVKFQQTGIKLKIRISKILFHKLKENKEIQIID